MSLILENKIKALCEDARDAYASISCAKTKQKDAVLTLLSKKISSNKEIIINANMLDVASAKDNGVPSTMIDRLTLTESRIDALCDSLLEIVKLKDPCGSGECFDRPSGISIKHVRVPIGVIGIIYEARPNVTVDAAALCIKTGNVCILKGGKEAINTNIALATLIREALEESGIDKNACSLIDITDREATSLLLTMKDYIDVLIPRGGKGLIKFVKENARMPIIETGAGNCHIYIDEGADLDKSLAVAINAKCQRPSVCNAVETLLVHSSVASGFLKRFKSEGDKYSLEIRGCERTQKIIECAPATDEDYFTEYNDYIISVKVVDSIDEAISHINRHSTHHSEAIMTRSVENAEKFTLLIDSAAVYVNASTRFTDGGEFGFGAEIGISTQKLHARGPMGLLALTSEKYIVTGDGTVR